MAKHSVEAAIEGLKNLLSENAEKEGLEEVAIGKIKQLTDELQMFRRPWPTGPFVDYIRTGFMKFKTTQFDMYPEKYEELAEGQHPKLLVFSCSDSRVSASNILSFLPGDAFMARNIANLVPQFTDKDRNQGTGAILEYAITALHVEHILVIGHSRCGGIARLMSLRDSEEHPYDFIDDWVKIATKAKHIVETDHSNEPFDVQCRICEELAVDLSLEHLKEYPYVEEGLKKTTLQLWGGYYDFVQGKFQLWNIGNRHHAVFP